MKCKSEYVPNTTQRGASLFLEQYIAQVRANEGWTALPTDATEFRQVHGIGDAKLVKFGGRFLEEISRYCRENVTARDVVDGRDSG